MPDSKISYKMKNDWRNYWLLVLLLSQVMGSCSSPSPSKETCTRTLGEREIQQTASSFFVENARNYGYGDSRLDTGDVVDEIKLNEGLYLYRCFFLSSTDFSVDLAVLYANEPVCLRQAYFVGMEGFSYEYLLPELMRLKEFIDAAGRTKHIPMRHIGEVLYQLHGMSKDSLLVQQGITVEGIYAALDPFTDRYDTIILRSDLLRLESVTDSILQNPVYQLKPVIFTHKFAHLLFIFEPSKPENDYVFILYRAPKYFPSRMTIF